MGTFTRVASRGDIPEGTGKTVEIGAKKIALFNVAGKFYAIDNECKHRGGPLGEGELDGCNVTCPLHGWEYDVTTGINLDDENVKVQTHPTRIDGDDVMVEV